MCSRVEAIELEVDFQPVAHRRPGLATSAGSRARRMPLVLIITAWIGCS